MFIPKKIIKELWVGLISLIFVGLILTPNISIFASETKTQNNPNYYYNRETAFILKNALDSNNGGMYVATMKDGATPNQTIPANVWGAGNNLIKYTDKSHIGQATCIRYLITEYQRANINGIEGINNLLPSNQKIQSPNDLLEKAKICADFAINKMTIGDRQSTTKIPNRLYYWSFTDQSGNSGQLDDTASDFTMGVSRSESAIPWSISELAIALKKAGLNYTKYQNSSLDYYNWRKNTATALPDYSINGSQEPGSGRDLFYPALAINLTELNNDPIYRDGDGMNNDNTPAGAIPFLNKFLDTPESLQPDLLTPPKSAMQDGSYTAGYGRAIVFSKYKNSGVGGAKASDNTNQMWDFGFQPLHYGDYPNYSVRTASDTFYSDKSKEAFAHYRGRELMAGVQKTAWFNYTQGVNPDSFYVKENPNGNKLNKEAYLEAVTSYWDYINTNMWDNTKGIEAWLEAVNEPYKPCFSGGNDTPIGDWLAPTIGNKTHVINQDNSATVTISDVVDPETPYLSWNFMGSGINKVEVVYSLDNGTSWKTILAEQIKNTNNYTATIPKVDVGDKVLYYARAKDNFQNWSAFPNNNTPVDAINGPLENSNQAVENWDEINQSVINTGRAQMYQIPLPKGDGNITITSSSSSSNTPEAVSNPIPTINSAPITSTTSSQSTTSISTPSGVMGLVRSGYDNGGAIVPALFLTGISVTTLLGSIFFLRRKQENFFE
jgi:hypothetical protein